MIQIIQCNQWPWKWPLQIEGKEIAIANTEEKQIRVKLIPLVIPVRFKNLSGRPDSEPTRTHCERPLTSIRKAKETQVVVRQAKGRRGYQLKQFFFRTGKIAPPIGRLVKDNRRQIISHHAT